MVVGFNHNFRYKGEVYHIQTEDSGVKSPNIVTLLYQGGTILASKKTSYADIVRIDNLEQVIEELMKEQHKEMLRSLKAGEFDAVIERFQAARKVAPQVRPIENTSVPQAEEKAVAAKPVPPEASPASPAMALGEPVAAPKSAPQAVPKAVSPAVAATQPPSKTTEHSLDEVILSYLMGDDK